MWVAPRESGGEGERGKEKRKWGGQGAQAIRLNLKQPVSIIYNSFSCLFTLPWGGFLPDAWKSCPE